MDYLKKKIPAQEQKKLLLCMISTFIFGLAADAYGLLNNIFSHDSLNALYAGSTENLAKISAGRFLVPVLRLFRGPVALPWLIGLIAFVFIGLSVYVIVKIFDVNSKPAMVLIAGIMVTNTTVTAVAATYVHELDLDMFALLLSCLAAYLWKKSTKIKELIPVGLLLITAIAIYQSYVELTVTLMIMVLLLDAIEGKEVKGIFIKGVRGAVTSAVATGIYFALNTLVRVIIKVDATKNIDFTKEYEKSFILRLRSAVVDIIASYVSPSTVYPAIIMGALSCAMFLGILICIVMMWKKNKLSKGNIFMTVLLTAMIPVGMNFLAPLSHEGVHDVMKFSFWMFLVLAVVLLFRYVNRLENDNRRKFVKVFSLIMASVILWNNILVANTVHLKKVLEHDVTLVTLERVIDDLEARDDYEIGKTEIAFSGYPQIHQIYPGFERVSRMTGAEFTMSIGVVNYKDYYNSYNNYFRYYFNYPIVISNTDYSKDPRVEAMPTFPEEGYIQKLDGKLVVNLGEKQVKFLKITTIARDVTSIKAYIREIKNKTK